MGARKIAAQAGLLGGLARRGIADASGEHLSNASKSFAQHRLQSRADGCADEVDSQLAQTMRSYTAEQNARVAA